LPQGWIDQKCTLQKKDHGSNAGTGHVPCRSGICGICTRGIQAYSSASEAIHGTLVVRDASAVEVADPSSGETDLYCEIGARFILEYRKEFGPAHYYLADTFNEMSVPVGPNRNRTWPDSRVRFTRAYRPAIPTGFGSCKGGCSATIRIFGTIAPSLLFFRVYRTNGW